MAKLRIYIAVSIDGFIATTDGKVGWLDPFNTVDYGYNDFVKDIGTIVYGRTTFEQELTHGAWPHAGRRAIVLTHRPLPRNTPAGVEAFEGKISGLIPQLRDSTGGDVWLIGGGKSIVPFLERGEVDSMDLFIMPVMLGDGIQLFPRAIEQQDFTLTASTPFPNGVVHLSYARKAPQNP